MITTGISPTGERFTFFWKTEDFPSQWNPTGFTYRDIRFDTAEHWMMYWKAMTFGHEAIIPDILAAKTPRKAKELGRKVQGLAGGEWDDADRALWNRVRKPLVLQGNILKFTQNPAALGWLMSTAGTTLVEASPSDDVWGIGLAANDPRALDRTQWLGLNLLGEAVTETREIVALAKAA